MRFSKSSKIITILFVMGFILTTVGFGQVDKNLNFKSGKKAAIDNHVKDNAQMKLLKKDKDKDKDKKNTDKQKENGNSNQGSGGIISSSTNDRVQPRTDATKVKIQGKGTTTNPGVPGK